MPVGKSPEPLKVVASDQLMSCKIKFCGDLVTSLLLVRDSEALLLKGGRNNDDDRCIF